MNLPVKNQVIYTIVHDADNPDEQEHFLDAASEGYWTNKKQAQMALKSGGYGNATLVKIEVLCIEKYRKKEPAVKKLKKKT